MLYLNNRHGDITDVVTNDSSSLNKYKYNSYGDIKEETERVKNRFKYSGEQYDDISGLYYLRARYYNPELGRFTQEDAYRGDGLNLYAYVSNNPINFVDPSGYCKESGSEVERNWYDYSPIRDHRPSINTPGIQGAYAYIDTLPEDEQQAMAEMADKIIKEIGLVGLNLMAGDIYDAEQIIIGYSFEEGRFLNLEERAITLALAAAPGSANMARKGLKTAGEVTQQVLRNSDTALEVAGAVSKKSDDVLRATKSASVRVDIDDLPKSTNPRAFLDEIVEETGKADFYVKPNGDVVPSTGYRYMSSDAGYLDDLSNTMTIPKNPNNTYVTFDNYKTPQPGLLQVPHDAAVKGSFDTLQIIDDVRIPNGQWGEADWLEPITTDFPKYGPGGATQAITNQKIILDELIYFKK